MPDNEQQSQLEQQLMSADQLIDWSQIINTDRILTQFQNVMNDRSVYNSRWNSIYTQIMFFEGFSDNRSTSGARALSASTIRNHTGIILGIINNMVSQLCSKIANPASLWLGLDIPYPVLIPNPISDQPLSAQLGEYEVVINWMKDLTEVLYQTFSQPTSNFYPAIYSAVNDFSIIGPCCIESSILPNTLDTGSPSIVYNTIDMENIYFEVDAWNQVNKVYRKIRLNAEQAYELFGENISDAIKHEIESGQVSSINLHKFVEVSFANPWYQQLPPYKPYITVVIDEQTRKLVKYPEFSDELPYVTGRFNSSGFDLYGRTYVWDALADIKTVNQTTKLILENMIYLVRPPIMVKDAMSLDPPEIFPQAIIPGLDMQGKAAMQTLPISGDANTLNALIQFLQMAIQQVERSLIIGDVTTPVNTPKTAFEVNVRDIQNNYRTLPFIIRFEKEVLQKLIKRTFSLLNQLGRLPAFPYAEVEEILFQQEPFQQLLMAMPPDLLSMLAPGQLLQMLMPDPIGQVNISFKGQMAKLQKLNEIQDLNTVLQQIFQYAQVDQSVLDYPNVQGIMKQWIESYQFSSEAMNPPKVREALQQQRQQQQQQQQLLQQAQANKLNSESDSINTKTAIERENNL